MASANDIRMRILAEDKTAAAFRSAKKNIDSTSKSVKLLKAAISIGVATAFVGLTKRMAESADQIAKFSQRIGINAQAFQELQYAATQSGIKTEQFNMAMQRFTRRAAEAAEGTGEAKAALRQLGIQLTDSNGRLRPAEELLGDVAEAFKNIEDPAQRVRLAFKLFDSEGVSMVQMLGQGRDAMLALRREAQQLGIVMDENTLKNAEKVSNQFDIMSRVIDTNLTTALVELGPVLVDLTKFIADAAAALSDFIANFRAIEDLSLNQINMQIDELEQKLNVFRELQSTIQAAGGDASGYALQISQIKEELNKLYDAQQKLGGGEPISIMPDMVIEGQNNLSSSFDEIRLGMRKGAEQYNNSIKSITEATADATQKAFKSMEDAIVQFAMTGKLNFKDFARSIISDLIRIQVQQQITSKIAGWFGSITGGGETPATGKAIGGPIQAGRPYLVGERGPELIVPNQNGSVIPNDKINAGGGVTINQTIQVSTGVSQTVRAEIANLMPQITSATKAAVADARMRGGSYSAAMGA